MRKIFAALLALALSASLVFAQDGINNPKIGHTLQSVTVLTSTNASYNPAANVTALYIEAVAGGGGGGYALGVASQFGVGGGGAGGACSKRWLTSVNAPYNITVGGGGTAGNTTGPVAAGAGGNTTVVDASSATLLSATGGAGGTGDASATTAHTIQGGNSPTATVGDNLFSGGPGGVGVALGVAAGETSGFGGTSGCGNPGPLGNVNSGVGGSAAANSGAGGAGGLSNNATARNGGAGGAGYVIIWAYY